MADQVEEDIVITLQGPVFAIAFIPEQIAQKQVVEFLGFELIWGGGWKSQSTLSPITWIFIANSFHSIPKLNFSSEFFLTIVAVTPFITFLEVDSRGISNYLKTTIDIFLAVIYHQSMLNIISGHGAGSLMLD